MSDNPILWVEYPHAPGKLETPSRADVLAALGDKEWYCVKAHCSYPDKPNPCNPDEPWTVKRHRGAGCHWAVKP